MLQENSLKCTGTKVTSKNGEVFSRFTSHPQYKRFVMEKITSSFAALAATIAMTFSQACVETADTQCAKPTPIPSDASHATTVE
jgi:hypothetical protein